MEQRDVRKLDLAKLNSMTKYPSVLPYHRMDAANKGALSDDFSHDFSGCGSVIGREKVDGTNARIVFPGSDTFILGSREDFLSARGDLISNPALHIATTLREKAEELVPLMREIHQGSNIVVVFVEVYGGNVHANSPQYTGNKTLGYRGFDVAVIDPGDLFVRTQEAIAQWRDAGGQTFLDNDSLEVLMGRMQIPMAPSLFEIESVLLPGTHEEALEFLKQHTPATLCSLDEGAGGKSEGIIVRSADRGIIAKMRYEDYYRTQKRLAKK